MQSIFGSKISSISLEGFQVFKEPTLIPMGRLTLLFGPNSAGKSAIQDALALYKEMRSVDFRDVQLSMIRKTLSRGYGLPGRLDNDPTHPPESNYLSSKLATDLFSHWRRSSDTTKTRAREMRIGVVHNLLDIKNLKAEIILFRPQDIREDGELPAYGKVQSCDFQSEFTLSLRDEFPESFPYKLPFQLSESSEEQLTYKPDYQLSNGRTLLIRKRNSHLFVNWTHPLLSPIAESINFHELAKKFPKEIEYKDGCINLIGDFLGFRANGTGFGEMRGNWLSLPLDVALKNKRSNWTNPLLIEALAEISLRVGSLLAALDKIVGHPAVVVDASRTVPKQNDLVFTLHGWCDGIPTPTVAVTSQYKELAESLACELVAKINPKVNANERGTFARNVNSALMDHLFKEKGYRIDFDFRVLLSHSNSVAVLENSKLNTSDLGLNVELHLRDASERIHAIKDVGSGIGYVLPVLCGLFNPDLAFYKFIQQPELHLHPALQAELGDVIIESVRTENQTTIIETHSEHLVLRILKRIRQTHLKSHIAPELRITADDVCVLYLAPGANDSTKVTHLRVSEDGEFIDRWPGGFFPERDQELFYE